MTDQATGDTGRASEVGRWLSVAQQRDQPEGGSVRHIVDDINDVPDHVLVGTSAQAFANRVVQVRESLRAAITAAERDKREPPNFRRLTL